MQNPLKSDDDAVKTDEADREHAGGTNDSANEAQSDAETKAADYRDDPSRLGASSDYAQRGTTNQYSGQGPGDESGNYTSGRDSKGAHSGSQEQWRGAAASPPQGNAGGAAQTPKEEAYGDVPSRSADPGQSSRGGFRDEGPSPHDKLQQKASDEKPGDDTTSQK